MHHHFISTDCDQHKIALRRIRSFVRRTGRITQRQQHALDTLWPVMGTNYQAQPLNLDVLFGRSRPITMDIGFGMGSYLVNMAAAHPEQHFLGIEVHLPGVGACLANAQEAGISNLRLICHDAVEVLEQMIPNMSLALVQLFFPDPWHKARHNKRRIIQSQFVELVGSKLSNDGILHIATDWQPYAEHMLSILSTAEFFRNLSSTGDYVPRPKDRPFTHFEQRGQRLGHGIRDLMFKKLSEQH